MPDWSKEIRRRLEGLALEPMREDEIVEELSQHLDDRYGELLSGGASPGEANRLALLELSERHLLARELRRIERQIYYEPIVLGARRSNMIGDLWQDLRYGLRMMRKTPGFTVVALLTLALAIGLNTAVFSIVNAVLLRPLAYAQPERLVLLRDEQGAGEETPPSYPEFLDWRDQSTVLETAAAYFNVSYTLAGAGEPEQLWGQRVSSNLLTMLGVAPLVGRDFRPEEDHPNAPAVAMIGYSLWQRRFGGDPNVVGTEVMLSDRPHTVVGVLPPGFRFIQSGDMSAGEGREVWVPLRLDPTRFSRGFHFLKVLGRLREGVALEQAQQEMNLLAERLKQERSTNHGVHLFGFQAYMVREARAGLLLLLAAVALVLLIGCVNVANLLLARAAARQREIAVRLSVGASRGRLIRQLLTESFLLAFGGGGLGILMAFWLVGFLKGAARDQIPRIQEVNVDGAVLAFTLGVSVVTGVLFGLWPALHALKADPYRMLKEGSQQAGMSRDRARSFLVISEVALSSVLLIAAGLVINSFVRLMHVPKGFDPARVLTFSLSPSRARYSEPRKQTQFFDQAMERLAVLPGVEAVGGVTDLPLEGSGTNGNFNIEGRGLAPDSLPIADKRIASENYFRAMGIRLTRGRFFADRDNLGAPQVAIVNEEFVRRFFPDEDPVGKRIDFMWETEGLQQIVGVVGDIRHESLDTPVAPEIYLPYRQRAPGGMSIVVRTGIDPASMIGAARQAIYGVDKEQAVSQVRAMEQVVAESVSSRRLSVILYGSFAGLALMLAVIGIYGVMSYTVSQRTHEIGLRVALGAGRRDLLKMVIGQGMKLAMIGAGAGLIAAVGLTRLMKSLLFDVSATDPLTFVAVTLLLASVALLACYVPARRAARVDPMVALRSE
jgi:putative ABC transport system permease protein